MYVGIGSATATATISGGVVTGCTVTNAGFGFSKPPVIRFFGGGNTAFNPTYIGSAAPSAMSPNNGAQAHCVMTGSAPNQTVSSIVVDFGGANYAIAPQVFIFNSDLDPNGCADPSLNSGNGIYLAAAGGSVFFNGTSCPTDSVSLFCGTISQPFTCKYMV